MSLEAELEPAFEATAPARRRRVPLLIVLCFLVIAVVVVCAVFGEAITPSPASLQRLGVGDTAPSAAFWAGTDQVAVR